MINSLLSYISADVESLRAKGIPNSNRQMVAVHINHRNIKMNFQQFILSLAFLQHPFENESDSS